MKNEQGGEGHIAGVPGQQATLWPSTAVFCGYDSLRY